MNGYYDEFFINEMKFTIEDYGEDTFALFHEGALVDELQDIDDAYKTALAYYKFFSY